MACPVCGRNNCNFLHDRPGGVRIITIAEKETAAMGQQMWRSDKRLYLNSDRSRIVEESDSDAAYLYATPGRLVPLDEAVRYGLAGQQDAAEPAVPENVEDDQEPQAPETGERATDPREDKRRTKDEDKSMEGESEDKSAISDDDDVTVINGIGKAFAKDLAEIGVKTVGDFKRKNDRDILDLGGISPARLREFRDQVG